MNNKIRTLIEALAGDADLATQYPQYRQAALEILADDNAPQLIWTIREAGIEFPRDEDLYAAALKMPAHNPNKMVVNIPGRIFSVQRFGNSARVYIKHPQAYEPKSVGLFTWDMSKAEAQGGAA